MPEGGKLLEHKPDGQLPARHGRALHGGECLLDDEPQPTIMRAHAHAGQNEIKAHFARAQVREFEVRALGDAHHVIERGRLFLRGREDALQLPSARFLLAEEGRADIGDDAVEGGRPRHRGKETVEFRRRGIEKTADLAQRRTVGSGRQQMQRDPTDEVLGAVGPMRVLGIADDERVGELGSIGRDVFRLAHAEFREGVVCGGRHARLAKRIEHEDPLSHPRPCGGGRACELPLRVEHHDRSRVAPQVRHQHGRGLACL